VILAICVLIQFTYGAIDENEEEEEEEIDIGKCQGIIFSVFETQKTVNDS